jgi:hypothetical protein
VTDPAKAKVALGKGSYSWDGAAGTWFWVDPANKVVFVADGTGRAEYAGCFAEGGCGEFWLVEGAVKDWLSLESLAARATRSQRALRTANAHRETVKKRVVKVRTGPDATFASRWGMHRVISVVSR